MTRTLGVTDYRRYCAALALPVDERLSPAARAAAVPPWMCPEIIATPAAVRKLQAWNRQPAPDRVEILERAAVIGDVDLARQMAGIMAERIPAPVVHYAIERVVFYAVAHDTGVLGFTAPAGHGSRPWVVALSKADGTAEQFGELFAHEVAHTWLLEEPAPGTEAPTAFRSATMQHASLTLVPDKVLATVLELRRDYDNDERQARALVKAWGFPGVL